MEMERTSDLHPHPARLFARWLAFLEMRGAMHGTPRARLDGFVHSFTASLPRQPIALPEEIEYYDEHEEVALARQWQRLNEGVQHLIERTVAEEQRQQLKQVSRRVNGVLLQRVTKRYNRHNRTHRYN